MLGIEREETKRQRQRGGNARKTQVGGTDEDFVVLDDLGFGKRDFVVRVAELAGGVFTAFDVGYVVAHFLHLLPMDVTIILCGDDICDFAFVGGEVVHDFAGVVMRVPLQEDGRSVNPPQGICHAARV